MRSAFSGCVVRSRLPERQHGGPGHALKRFLARAPNRCERTVIDVDASLTRAYSAKESAAGNCKGGYGHHPLLITSRSLTWRSASLIPQPLTVRSWFVLTVPGLPMSCATTAGKGSCGSRSGLI